MKRKIHFIPMADRETYRYIMLQEGFSPEFIDRTVLPEFYEKKREPGMQIVGNCIQEILRREPEDFRTWLIRNSHLFVT